MLDDIVPNGTEVLHQLGFTRLGIEIGDTCIEVVGTNGMSHSLVLVAELMTVLVVVLTISYAIADSNESLGQRQVFLVASLTVHLCSTHIVAWTDGITREFGGIVGQEIIKEIGSLPSTVE